MCIHCLLRKQKCSLKSTTTNGWRHFGQSEQRKSSALFSIQSEKSPDSGIFTCDPTKKCIMPSSRERHKGIIGRGHDLRLLTPWYKGELQTGNPTARPWSRDFLTFAIRGKCRKTSTSLIKSLVNVSGHVLGLSGRSS